MVKKNKDYITIHINSETIYYLGVILLVAFACLVLFAMAKTINIKGYERGYSEGYEQSRTDIVDGLINADESISNSFIIENKKTNESRVLYFNDDCKLNQRETR